MHAVEQIAEPIQVVLRSPSADELQIVRDTWVNTCKPPVQPVESPFSKQSESWVRVGHNEVGKGNYRWIAPSLFHMAHRGVIEKLLETCTVEVAVLPDMPDDVVGWVAFDPPSARPLTIHYVYVLGDLRRHKIGTRLFAAALQTGTIDDRLPRFTHLTNYGRKFLEGMRR